MDKRENTASHVLARFRGFIQAAATLITNIHLPNFAKGGIYQGAGKTVCVPGLNCYSCPAASGACPIGSFQSVVGSSKFNFSYYVTGTLILLGVLLGRFVCGFLCPFGWLQELLHKIPGKKFSTKKLKPLTYIKYVVLLFAVVVLPVLVVNDLGMGDPFFCKYICPQGVLEGAIPLAIANAGIRSALGQLFTWKLAVLIAVVVLSKKGVTYKNIWFKSDSEAGKFTSNLFSFPTTYVIDQNGNIVGDPIVGAISSAEQRAALDKLIDQAIANSEQ